MGFHIREKDSQTKIIRSARRTQFNVVMLNYTEKTSWYLKDI